MRELVVAAAQPPCVGKDVEANARAHAAAVREAGARVVVFPELSLTGYELDAPAVSPDDEKLAPLVAACAEAGTVAFVGAPVAGDFNALLQVSGAGATVAYRKQYLGGAEDARFAAGPGPAAVAVDGWRIGLGVCKDTGVAEHVADVAALGVDLYLAGVLHHVDELAEQDARGVRIARAADAYVAFASFAGPTGGGYDRSAGASTIWSPGGGVLARAGDRPGEIARATLSA